MDDGAHLLELDRAQEAPRGQYRAAPSVPRLVSRSQLLCLTVVLIGVLCGLLVAPIVTLTVVNAMLLVFFMAAHAMKLALVRWSLKNPAEEVSRAASARLPESDLPIYTILLPVYHEAAVLPQLVASIDALDYPRERLDVKLLLEEDDVETQDAANRLGIPDCFEILLVPDVGPPGKPRACNHGLNRARGEFLVIFDAEDCPEPAQLRESLATFADRPAEVVCLQAKLNYFNRDHNLLTRWFTAEYSVWFDQFLPGLEYLDVAIPLGGTSNHFVTQCLRDLGGWNMYNVTEDADLGVRIYLRGWKTGILAATTYEEATSRFGNWLRQRSRWIKGYMQTYLLHMEHPVRAWRQMGSRAFAAFQLFFGANTLCLLLNPIYFVLIFAWFGWHPPWLQSLFPAPIFYLALVGLFIANVAWVLSLVSGCYARRNYTDVKWAFLAPVYWLAMSLASYKALVQLIRNPWYWEKTDHGFCRLDDYPSALAPAPASRHPVGETVPREAYHRPELIPAPATAATAPSPGGRYQRTRGWAAPAWLAAHELTPVIAAALLAALSASVWSGVTHSMTLYGDAMSHLDVARRVTDGLRTGLTQLGSVWLPLPHLLLVPLVAVRGLWHSGIAGAIVSGTCFVYSATRIYSLVKELSGSRTGAWCAFAVFALNFNMLYVQTTALTEPVLLAFCVGSVYHLARWMRTFSIVELTWAAALAALAVLSRYEGWALFIGEAGVVAIWGLMADRRRASAQANFLLFTLIGAYAIALWLLYNLIIFHDALYFLHSNYSAQVINGGQSQFGLLGTKGHLGTAFLTYGWDLVGVIGPVVLIAAVLSIVLLFTGDPGRRRTLFVLGIFAAPIAFLIATLYAGQITIRVPQLAPHEMWNDRYGLVALPLCAVAIGCAAGRRPSLAAPAIGVAVAGAIVMSVGNPLTLADGQRGFSSARASDPQPAANYIHREYRGGEIMADDLAASPMMFESHLDLNQYVSPGFHPYWERALAAPALHVEWVIAYPGDAVAADIAAHPRRFAEFRLVLTGRARVYKREAATARVLQEPATLRAVAAYSLAEARLDVYLREANRAFHRYAGHKPKRALRASARRYRLIRPISATCSFSALGEGAYVGHYSCLSEVFDGVTHTSRRLLDRDVQCATSPLGPSHCSTALPTAALSRKWLRLRNRAMRRLRHKQNHSRAILRRPHGAPA
jgi:cellulose synthase/poly-beta-1,6-N-acetylglucosamine synthase-like glycosyltransferase